MASDDPTVLEIIQEALQGLTVKATLDNGVITLTRARTWRSCVSRISEALIAQGWTGIGGNKTPTGWDSTREGLTIYSSVTGNKVGGVVTFRIYES